MARPRWTRPWPRIALNELRRRPWLAVSRARHRACLVGEGTGAEMLARSASRPCERAWRGMTATEPWLLALRALATSRAPPGRPKLAGRARAGSWLFSPQWRDLGRTSLRRARSEAFGCLVFAAPRAWMTGVLRGLTFELSRPWRQTPAGRARMIFTQAWSGQTVAAVAGRRLERGVRPRSAPCAWRRRGSRIPCLR